MKCGKIAQPARLRFQQYDLDGWRCECGEEYFNPLQACWMPQFQAGIPAPKSDGPVLADEPDHKVKRIVVKPGKRLSLQRHQKRAEHWYIIFGQAIVTLNEQKLSLQEVYAPLRYLLTGSFEGLALHDILEMLDDDQLKRRLGCV